MFSDQYHPGRNVLLGEFKRRTEPKYTYDDCSIVHSSDGRIVISNSVSENIQFDFNPITGYSKDGQPNGLLVVSGTTYPVCFTCRERDISSSIHGLAKWRGTNLTRVLELATEGTGYPMIGFASRNRRQEMINRYIMVLKDTLINTDNLYNTIHKFMLDEATIKQVVDALDNRINDGWQRGGNEKLLRDLNKISIDMKKTPIMN